MQTDTNRIEPLALPTIPATHDGEQLAALQQRLQLCEDVGQLLARACDEARAFCGFDRAIIAQLDGRQLTTTGLDALADPASDLLRRRLLAEPIALPADSVEIQRIRRRQGDRPGRPRAASVLQQALALDHYALGMIAPQWRVLAILAVDRAERPVDALDERSVELFAHLAGLALQTAVLETRLRELSREVHYMTASTRALAREAIETPIGLPSNHGQGLVFASVSPLAPAPSDRVRDLLSQREIEVMDLIVEGRSNREIGAALCLSAETVKTHVAHLLRKLAASNRAEATSRYLRLTQASAP